MKTRWLDDDFSFFFFPFRTYTRTLSPLYLIYFICLKLNRQIFSFHNVLIKSSVVWNYVNLHTNLQFVSIHIEAERK